MTDCDYCDEPLPSDIEEGETCHPNCEYIWYEREGSRWCVDCGKNRVPEHEDQTCGKCSGGFKGYGPDVIWSPPS